MASRRIARLNEQLRRELSELLRTSVRDPRVGAVTVTAVRAAPDLTTARVHVRLPGGEEERRHSLEGLHAAAPFLRRTLGQILHVRRIPELRFLPDDSLEHAQRIEAILAEVLPPEADDEEPEGTASGEDEREPGDGEDEDEQADEEDEPPDAGP